MPYEWDSAWADVADPINPTYTASVRRMVMASINWIAEHPDAYLAWTERDIAKPLNAVVIAAWEAFYIAENAETMAWFQSISDACAMGNPDHAPSASMMGKALACGLIFKTGGWQEFDQLLRSLRMPPTPVRD